MNSELSYQEVEERHTQMVAHLAKAGSQIHDELTSKKKAMLIASCYLSINISQIVDLVKRTFAYNKSFNSEEFFKLKEDATECLSALTDSVNDKEETIDFVNERHGLSDQECHALHMSIGLFGEAGEILEAIIKSIAEKTPVNLVNLDEELGDSEFFAEGLRSCYGLSRKTILCNNHTKLMHKRYPNGFSNEAAIARADKQEVENTPELTGMAKIDGEIVETYQCNPGSEADCKSGAICS